MKKNLLILLVGIILGFASNLVLNTVYADATVSTGAVIDSSSVQAMCTIQSGKRGCLVNKGSATVYINWAGGTVDATTDAGNNKAYLDSSDSIRIPSNVKRFTHATASSTAKLIFVED